MHTWGISGPQFLLIYGALLVAAPAQMGGMPELDPYEIAYLNGGRRWQRRPPRRTFSGAGSSTNPTGNPSRCASSGYDNRHRPLI
jgi:hypothetical protein